MRRRELILLLFMTASVQSAARAEPVRKWRVSDDLSVQEIRPGIWIHTSWQTLEGGLRFPSNGLLVRDGDALILIDTAWGVESTEALMEWIESEIKLPVAEAVVTHFHDDRMGGAPVLSARGIPFVAHPLTRVLGRDEGVPLPSSLGDLPIGGVIQRLNIDVFYPGPGHSEDNLVVWVPDAKVLFGGCAVRSPEFAGTGNTEDANLAEWPKAIRRVRERYPDTEIVVPGHGRPGDMTLLSHTIGLFEQ